MKRISLLCLLLLSLTCIPYAAFAQSTTGALVGTVTDPSGATVTGAKVTVRNTSTNQTWILATERTAVIPRRA